MYALAIDSIEPEQTRSGGEEEEEILGHDFLGPLTRYRKALDSSRFLRPLCKEKRIAPVGLAGERYTRKTRVIRPSIKSVATSSANKSELVPCHFAAAPRQEANNVIFISGELYWPRAIHFS